MPSLVVESQSSLSRQQYVEDGVPQAVHVVVKANIFDVQLRLQGDGLLDFDTCVVQGSLVYARVPARNSAAGRTAGAGTSKVQLDADADVRVPAVGKEQLLKYRGTIDPQDRSLMKLQCQVYALSSKHQNLNFKVRLELAAIPVAKQSAQQQRVQQLIEKTAPVFTEPLRTISKPEVLHKQARAERGLPRKKRTHNEMVLESLTRIEELQARQLALLESGANGEESAGDGDQKPAVIPPPSFERAFQAFVSAYKNIDPDDRPLKIRKLVHQVPLASQQLFSESVAIFNQESAALLQQSVVVNSQLIINNNNNNDDLVNNLGLLGGGDGGGTSMISHNLNNNNGPVMMMEAPGGGLELNFADSQDSAVKAEVKNEPFADLLRMIPSDFADSLFNQFVTH